MKTLGRVEKTEREKKKAEQILLLEYLLDPFMTFDEAVSLSRLSYGYPSETYPKFPQVLPSNRTAPAVVG